MPKATPAQLKAIRKWSKKAYDTKVICFRKGELDHLRALAQSQQCSVQGLIRQAMYAYGLIDSVEMYSDGDGTKVAPIRKKPGNPWNI